MAPLLNEPRLRTRIAKLQRQVDELQASHNTRVTTLQRQLDEVRSSHNALEEVVKNQAILSKQLEARLNRAEQTQPPPYANIPALTKDSAARKR